MSGRLGLHTRSRRATRECGPDELGGKPVSPCLSLLLRTCLPQTLMFCHTRPNFVTFSLFVTHGMFFPHISLDFLFLQARRWLPSGTLGTVLAATLSGVTAACISTPVDFLSRSKPSCEARTRAGYFASAVAPPAVSLSLQRDTR